MCQLAQIADSPSYAQEITVALSPLVMGTYCRKVSRKIRMSWEGEQKLLMVFMVCF